VSHEDDPARARNDPANATDRADELGDRVLGRDGVVEQRRVERPTGLAHEDAGRLDHRAHRLEDPLGALRVAQPRSPVGEDRVVETRLIEGETTGHLPADPVGQGPGGVAIRKTLEGLQDHDRGDRVGRDRGAAALGKEQVFEHLVGKQFMTMIGQERLDASLRHELSTERRRVKQFTIGFAESLHVTILDDRCSRIRLCEPNYSTVS
jgi:hypothetical protein